jgi:hypothetical protein
VAPASRLDSLFSRSGGDPVVDRLLGAVGPEADPRRQWGARLSGMPMTTPTR